MFNGLLIGSGLSNCMCAATHEARSTHEKRRYFMFDQRSQWLSCQLKDLRRMQRNKNERLVIRGKLSKERSNVGWGVGRRD